MSILYCSIPHFAAALARRDDPGLQRQPLVLLGSDRHVFAVSAEAAACGIAIGSTANTAQVRCPEARLLEADVARCRSEFEMLLELLELTSPQVEPHGWGAAYVDLGGLAPHHTGAVSVCQEVGRAVRRELGDALQPALGWDSTKFTAQAATQYTQPGRLLAVATLRERPFLQPLPVTLLPLEQDALQRLGFLGLRTLGQYAALPPGAVWQLFGRGGRLAQRCARGEDDRPVVPRSHQRHLSAHRDLEGPLADRERLLAALQHLVAPLLLRLRDNLQACRQIRLTVHSEGGVQEREHVFLFPTAEERRAMLILAQLLGQMHWRTGATGLEVTLEGIQDAVVEQLPLVSGASEQERKLREVQRHLATRFGANRLRLATLSQPCAPLPEWRIHWLSGDGT